MNFLDVNGEDVYIGDLVEILPEENYKFQWLGEWEVISGVIVEKLIEDNQPFVVVKDDFDKKNYKVIASKTQHLT